jgi:hypothetical protein
MSNAIAGGIAVILCCVFFLYYAIRLESVVLWIIILGNLGCLVYDYWQSVTGKDEGGIGL